MNMIDTKDLKMIGHGLYGEVYRLSPQRVLKVYKTYDTKRYNLFLKDEIEGSKRKWSLPVIRTIKVRYNGRIVKGLVKRYIPNEFDSDHDFMRKIKENKIRLWCDDHYQNFRMDKKGNIYRIDTQLWKYVK